MDRSVTNVAKKKTLHTTRYHLAKEPIMKRLKRERGKLLNLNTKKRHNDYLHTTYCS